MGHLFAAHTAPRSGELEDIDRAHQGLLGPGLSVEVCEREVGYGIAHLHLVAAVVVLGEDFTLSTASQQSAQKQHNGWPKGHVASGCGHGWKFRKSTVSEALIFANAIRIYSAVVHDARWEVLICLGIARKVG